MKLLNTRSLTSGMVLAKSIYNENGRPLVAAGISLTDRVIQRLAHMGITYVYVDDKDTADIIIESPVPEQLRIKATKQIKEIFSEVSKGGKKEKSYILDKNGKALRDIVQQLLREIRQSKNQLSMIADMFVTDHYIFQHSLNVTIYTLALASQLKFPEKKLMEIGLGALLHDVGKIFIDDKILQKPGKLSDQEYEEIKKHTEFGFEYLRQQIEIPSVVAHCAYEHHERIDGSGYPRGLKGDEIHTYGKILAVADVFDAVTSNRVYRNAMLPHEGLEILYGGSIHMFEQSIVESFKKSIIVYPTGLQVELSDGRKGIVAKQNSNMNERPTIRILEENNKRINSPYEVDLREHLDVMITSVFKE